MTIDGEQNSHVEKLKNLPPVLQYFSLHSLPKLQTLHLQIFLRVGNTIA